MTQEVDYRELLGRYMAAVIACEGTTFIDEKMSRNYLRPEDRESLYDIYWKVEEEHGL